MCQSTPIELLAKQLLEKLRERWSNTVLSPDEAEDNLQLRKALARYLEN